MEQTVLYQMFEKRFPCESGEPVLPDCAVFWQEGEKEAKRGTSAIRTGTFRRTETEFAVRFMPEQEGVWHYEIRVPGTVLSGDVLCVREAAGGVRTAGECASDMGPEEGCPLGARPAAGGCHGRVVAAGDGFAYLDGEKFLPFGTTCYAWIYQPEERQEQTLATLAGSCFNKLRMLVFPKHMPYNNEEPERFPYLRDGEGGWDIKRPDLLFWERLDQVIARLGELGIETDLILFHPYDRWGFSELSGEESRCYLEYCIARLSAFHNLWWSLANEYEMVIRKNHADWDAAGELIRDRDPYGHLISIHNIMQLYPKRDWMTHCSIQSSDLNRIPYWKKKYGCPILIDECGYEGNLEFNWGNLSAFDMADRFWWTVTRGGYCTHGETFHREDEVLWWSKGGVLHGESEPRIRFLKDLLYELPGVGKADPMFDPQNPNEERRDGHKPNEKDLRFLELVRTSPEEEKFGMYGDSPKKLAGEGWQLYYFGRSCPCRVHVRLPEGECYDAQRIDIWEMTRTPLAEGVSGNALLVLPGKPGTAVLLRRREPEAG